jgi:hypothetical protein
MHSPPTETREPTSSNERWSVANRPRNLTKSRYSSGQRKRGVSVIGLFFLAESFAPPFPGVGRGTAGAKGGGGGGGGRGEGGAAWLSAAGSTPTRSASSRLRSGYIIYKCPRSAGSSLATISPATAPQRNVRNRVNKSDPAGKNGYSTEPNSNRQPTWRREAQLNILEERSTVTSTRIRPGAAAR